MVVCQSIVVVASHHPPYNITLYTSRGSSFYCNYYQYSLIVPISGANSRVLFAMHLRNYKVSYECSLGLCCCLLLQRRTMPNAPPL